MSLRNIKMCQKHYFQYLKSRLTSHRPGKFKFYYFHKSKLRPVWVDPPNIKKHNLKTFFTIKIKPAQPSSPEIKILLFLQEKIKASLSQSRNIKLCQNTIFNFLNQGWQAILPRKLIFLLFLQNKIKASLNQPPEYKNMH